MGSLCCSFLRLRRRVHQPIRPEEPTKSLIAMPPLIRRDDVITFVLPTVS